MLCANSAVPFRVLLTFSIPFHSVPFRVLLTTGFVGFGILLDNPMISVTIIIQYFVNLISFSVRPLQ